MAQQSKPTSLAKARVLALCDDLHFVADEIVALAPRAKDPASALEFASRVRDLAYLVPQIWPQPFTEGQL
jgi:hypothetical protein